MKIHNLPGDPGRQQKTKRLGRGPGSGHGKTSGKGHKGSQARAGHSKGTDDGFEGGQVPLIRRIPKGGFKNPFRIEFEVVNVASLEKCFTAGDLVNHESLAAAGLISKPLPIKILGDGELTKALTVEVEKISKSALEKIEKAGGSAREVTEEKILTVKLAAIEEKFEAGATVDRKALEAAGLIEGEGLVRVNARSHGKRELSKAITLQVDMVTPIAERKIREAGGTC